MELPAFTCSQSPASRLFPLPLYSKCAFYRCFFRRVTFTKRLNRRSPNLSLLTKMRRRASVAGVGGDQSSAPWNLATEATLVEVIAIGSRKDAVLDFCLDSPLASSSSLRFWDISVKDSANVQLQERVLGKDLNTRNLELSGFLQSCSKAIVLVASAGYGMEHITAIEIFKIIKSRAGFAVAVFLKPFSFEGQRRLGEVKLLVRKLQANMDFCIDIDTDALLTKDLVTLDEALKTANGAVLLAINAISALLSMHQKRIDGLQNNTKELKSSEVMEILESYKEAKIGFGAGNNFRSSILQALYDCPFIGYGVQDLKGIVVCIIASSVPMDDGDVNCFLHIFRQAAKYSGEIIFCTTHEPNLEPNTLVTTVLIVGCGEVQGPQKSSIFSRLVQHFPFVFKLLRREHQQAKENNVSSLHTDACLSNTIYSPEIVAMEYRTVEDIADGVDEQSEELKTISSSNCDSVFGLRNYNHGTNEGKFGALETATDLSNVNDKKTEGIPSFQREAVIRWNFGPAHQIALEWAKERVGTTSVLDSLSIFHLPVGVRSPKDLNGRSISFTAEISELKPERGVKEQMLPNLNTSSWSVLTDAGFVAVKDICDNASAFIKGRNADVPKKQGVLSVRAASMLEAERESPKRWSPIKEMQYRGGVYRGRCQGGLPEGKGRLILGDGSIYDGMWRYGKRSGPGALYFSNGDVFQGSWRDDMMHGKGWFYFHTGDRWFANFWKGKANGESRFYSKSGDVFFGHFQDGWRHGHFLCIDVNGVRCVEMWNEGVLVNRKPLDPETDSG